jgi:23S rRNA (adenine1618-N6)-methyltransferase
VAGLDVGCGANLIYPLLAAALCGWRMVGADVTPAALRWAARNLGANPQLRRLIELRQVAMQPNQAEVLGGGGHGGGGAGSVGGAAAADAVGGALAEDEAGDVPAALAAATPAPVVLLGGAAAGRGLVSGALRAGERLAFCMCNPPFFESMAEAGRNPATAYGGTPAEMVYPGGPRRLLPLLWSRCRECEGCTAAEVVLPGIACHWKRRGWRRGGSLGGAALAPRERP